MSTFDPLPGGTGAALPPGGPGDSLPQGARDRKLVAPLWHTALLILFVFALLAWQAYKLHVLGAQQLTPFARRIPNYFFMIGFEWTLLAFVWGLGLRRTRTPLRALIGGRWKRAADPFIDLGIAFLFWIVVAVVLVACRLALGANPTASRAVLALAPQTLVESLLWVVVAVSAGFCEELVFRGYLQRQFFALTGSDGAAIALQAVVFGSAHGYQGIRGVITITLYGALFGVLAMMRRSLRPGMMQHSMQDMTIMLLRFMPKH